LHRKQQIIWINRGSVNYSRYDFGYLDPTRSATVGWSLDLCDMVQDLTKHLILWQPSDPLDALIQYLEKRKAVSEGEQKDGNEDEEAPVSTEQKALEYLEEHQIEKLLEVCPIILLAGFMLIPNTETE
jgi:hypothetical protein